MKHEEQLYFIHMLECIYKIESFTTGGIEAFLHSVLIRDAVYRNLEVLGEAATHVGTATRKNLSNIPWRKIVGMRNVLIHQYEGVEPEVTWVAVERELPKLKSVLEQLVPDTEKMKLHEIITKEKT